MSETVDIANNNSISSIITDKSAGIDKSIDQNNITEIWEKYWVIIIAFILFMLYIIKINITISDNTISKIVGGGIDLLAKNKT